MFNQGPYWEKSEKVKEIRDWEGAVMSWIAEKGEEEEGEVGWKA